MFTAYVITSEAGKIYIGHTENIEDRLARHNKFLPAKNKSYTYKNGQIWRLIYKEEFNTRKEAIKREGELKSFRGREYIRNMIKKY